MFSPNIFTVQTFILLPKYIYNLGKMVSSFYHSKKHQTHSAIPFSGRSRRLNMTNYNLTQEIKKKKYHAHGTSYQPQQLGANQHFGSGQVNKNNAQITQKVPMMINNQIHHL